MRSSTTSGRFRRAWTALGRALKRGLLGKSSRDYMKQFTGSDEYFDEAIAAQRGWPVTQRKATEEPETHHAQRAGPS